MTGLQLLNGSTYHLKVSDSRQLEDAYIELKLVVRHPIQRK